MIYSEEKKSRFVQRLRLPKHIDNLFCICAMLSLIGGFVGIAYAYFTGQQISLTLTVTQNMFTVHNFRTLLFIFSSISLGIYTLFDIHDLFEYVHKLFFIVSFIGFLGFIAI